MSPSPLYAVIDLGSNSFHMLIARLVADSVQIVDKVKRKVRLASGLDNEGNLDQASMARGIECLSFFAERLQDIPPENIRIVATATLRIANNAETFLQQAKHVLGTSVTLLSGKEEAELIYLGVAHTSCSGDQRLVIDIGGASTELVVGHAFKSIKAISMDIGCVTFNNRYFGDGNLNESNFNRAIAAANQQIAKHSEYFKSVGWQSALSGSGTMQALAEILMHQRRPAIISLAFLQQMKQELLQCQRISKISVAGLSQERIPVFASGLSILIALFERLAINNIQLSNGALREGLLYEMLPDMRDITIRQRTINSLTERFHIDTEHANRVTAQAQLLFDKFSHHWPLAKDNSYTLLVAACALHEVGLLLEYKHHQVHSAYIIENADLPGFEQADKQLLAALIRLHKGDINTQILANQCATEYQQACYLLVIMRLAVLLCHRRQDDVMPQLSVQFSERHISLQIDKSWVDAHPLMVAELNQEHNHYQSLQLALNVVAK